MNTSEHDWRHRTNCTIDDAAMFDLAGKTGPEAQKARVHARGRCMGCPVLNECREEIMASEGNADTRRREEFRAGMTPGERSKLARARRLAAQNAAARTLADTRTLDAAEKTVARAIADRLIDRMDLYPKAKP